VSTALTIVGNVGEGQRERGSGGARETHQDEVRLQAEPKAERSVGRCGADDGRQKEVLAADDIGEGAERW